MFGSIGFSGGFSLSDFNKRSATLGLGLIGLLPKASAARGLSTAA